MTPQEFNNFIKNIAESKYPDSAANYEIKISSVRHLMREAFVHGASFMQQKMEAEYEIMDKLIKDLRAEIYKTVNIRCAVVNDRDNELKILKLNARIKTLTEALLKITFWKLPTPPDNKSYAWHFGSNGERDYFRHLAHCALVNVTFSDPMQFFWEKLKSKTKNEEATKPID